MPSRFRGARNAHQQAERAVRHSVEQGPAKLCIAAQPTIARILFGRLGHALKARYPLTQVHFVEGLAADILARLSEGVHLITPADYPLAGDSVDVRELGEIPLILPSTHHGLRLLVESLAHRYRFSSNIALECDGSISITTRLVLEGCGCTVLPQAAVIEEVQAGRLKSYRLEGHDVQRTIAMVWPKNRIAADGLWAVTQIIRQRAVDMVEQGLWPGAQLPEPGPGAIPPDAPAG